MPADALTITQAATIRQMPANIPWPRIAKQRDGTLPARVGTTNRAASFSAVPKWQFLHMFQ
jgi:hypothetical protein